MWDSNVWIGWVCQLLFENNKSKNTMLTQLVLWLHDLRLDNQSIITRGDRSNFLQSQIFGIITKSLLSSRNEMLNLGHGLESYFMLGNMVKMHINYRKSILLGSIFVSSRVIVSIMLMSTVLCQHLTPFGILQHASK